MASFGGQILFCLVLLPLFMAPLTAISSSAPLCLCVLCVHIILIQGQTRTIGLSKIRIYRSEAMLTYTWVELRLILAFYAFNFVVGYATIDLIDRDGVIAYVTKWDSDLH